MNQVIFEGCATAIVTPFCNNKIDFESLGKVIDYQIAGGIKALIVLGTTGEASTLTFEEEREIIKFAKTRIAGRAKMIIGTGSNDTITAIESGLTAKELGADALLVVTPYYNKCTQKGLIAHYNAIIDATKMPIILYNVPGRTGMNIAPATVLELSKNPLVAGLKEASGNFPQILQLAKLLQGKLALYSGDDPLDFACLALGFNGMISVTANALPRQKVDMYEAFKKGDLKKARELHNNLLEINTDLFCEVNPIPVKAAMKHLGLCSDELRMPLTVIEDVNRKKVLETLKKTLNSK